MRTKRLTEKVGPDCGLHSIPSQLLESPKDQRALERHFRGLIMTRHVGLSSMVKIEYWRMIDVIMKVEIEDMTK